MKKAKMLNSEIKTDEAKAKLAQAEKDFEGDHLKKWKENRQVRRLRRKTHGRRWPGHSAHHQGPEGEPQ